MAKIVVLKNSAGLSRQKVFNILSAALDPTAAALVNSQRAYSLTQEIISGTMDLRIQDRLEYIRQIDVGENDHYIIVFFYDRTSDPVALISIYGSNAKSCPLYFRAQFDIRSADQVELKVLFAAQPTDEWLSNIRKKQ